MLANAYAKQNHEVQKKTNLTAAYKTFVNLCNKHFCRLENKALQ